MVECVLESDTQRAEDIRKYYLTLEKVFKAYVKYRHEIALRS
jgi:hypothetical protein